MPSKRRSLRKPRSSLRSKRNSKRQQSRRGGGDWLYDSIAQRWRNTKTGRCKWSIEDMTDTDCANQIRPWRDNKPVLYGGKSSKIGGAAYHVGARASYWLPSGRVDGEIREVIGERAIKFLPDPSQRSIADEELGGFWIDNWEFDRLKLET